MIQSLQYVLISPLEFLWKGNTITEYIVTNNITSPGKIKRPNFALICPYMKMARNEMSEELIVI